MSGDRNTQNTQSTIQFEALGDNDDFLFQLLGLKVPLRQQLSPGDDGTSTSVCSRQLRYLCQYVRELGCKTVVVEMKYVDRHFIEDFGAFYARMFSGCSNHCKRLHFFKLPPAELKQELQRLRETAASEGNDETRVEVYRKACREFSKNSYLGFSVIRPLRGAPIGRTVVKTYPAESAKRTHRRRYPAVHLNKAHLLGVELSVDGIAFQEQDGGVSACATTAIWSSIHYLKGSESIPVPTPAEITRLAGRMVSPSG